MLFLLRLGAFGTGGPRGAEGGPAAGGGGKTHVDKGRTALGLDVVGPHGAAGRAGADSRQAGRAARRMARGGGATRAGAAPRRRASRRAAGGPGRAGRPGAWPGVRGALAVRRPRPRGEARRAGPGGGLAPRRAVAVSAAPCRRRRRLRRSRRRRRLVADREWSSSTRGEGWIAETRTLVGLGASFYFFFTLRHGEAVSPSAGEAGPCARAR